MTGWGCSGVRTGRWICRALFEFEGDVGVPGGIGGGWVMGGDFFCLVAREALPLIFLPLTGAFPF